MRNVETRVLEFMAQMVEIFYRYFCSYSNDHPFWTPFGSLVPVICNCTLCAQMHELPQAIVVIPGRAHCFHDCIYITLILLLWDLSTLCVVDHLWPLVYMYICIVYIIYSIYIYIYIIYMIYIYICIYIWTCRSLGPCMCCLSLFVCGISN